MMRAAPRPQIAPSRYGHASSCRRAAFHGQDPAAPVRHFDKLILTQLGAELPAIGKTHGTKPVPWLPLGWWQTTCATQSGCYNAQMTNSLSDPTLNAVLQRLHAAAEANDPPLLSEAHRKDPPGLPLHADSEVATLLGEAYIPVPPETGTLLYLLARGAGSNRVVEFGTSFGISTIYLAAAVRDHGGQTVISTEINPRKVERARRNIEAAGLAEYVEIREGDALETLRVIDGPVDLLFLDGWKDLYLPVLKLLEPALRSEALVVADDLDKYREAHKPFLEFITNPANGYVSIEIPVGDRLAL